MCQVKNNIHDKGYVYCGFDKFSFLIFLNDSDEDDVQIKINNLKE